MRKNRYKKFQNLKRVGLYLSLSLTLTLSPITGQKLQANLIFSEIHNSKVVTSVLQCSKDILYKSNKDDLAMVSQLNTGEYSEVNCGPACLEAVVQYKGKSVDVQTLNSIKPPTDLGYSQYDMMEFLDKIGISYSTGKLYKVNTELNVFNELVTQINENNILILAIDTGEITVNRKSDVKGINGKKGRTYTGKFNHYIICTGYLMIDGELYFQIFDPYEQNYSAERYYTSTDLYNAITGNWNGYLSFNKLG